MSSADANLDVMSPEQVFALYAANAVGLSVKGLERDRATGGLGARESECTNEVPAQRDSAVLASRSAVIGGRCCVQAARLPTLVHVLVFGPTGAGRLLTAAFTVRRQRIRIISVRDMSRQERRRYVKAR